MKTYERLMIGNMKAVEEYPEQFHMSSPQKISSKAKSSFSLPAGPRYSCPGATEACADCYASKGRFYFPPVQKALSNNYKLIRKLQRNRAPNKAVELLSSAIPKKATLNRLHSSGDFFSQWYLDRWTEVIRNRRDTQFWAYTRSFHLNFQKLVRQPNFQLWASTDDYNQKEAEQFVKRYAKSGVRHAYGPWEHDAPIPKGSVVCPTTAGKLDLIGACEKCKICFRGGKKNIVFLRH